MIRPFRSPPASNAPAYLNSIPVIPPFSASAGSHMPKPGATPPSAHATSETGAAKDAPKTVGDKPIEVKWRTARAYSYQADEHPNGHSLLDHPQGMKVYHGVERRPRRIESVAREMGGDVADGPGDGVLRRKYGLKHYLTEFGASAVQNGLSYLPVQGRRPPRSPGRLLSQRRGLPFGAGLGGRHTAAAANVHAWRSGAVPDPASQADVKRRAVIEVP